MHNPCLDDIWLEHSRGNVDDLEVLQRITSKYPLWKKKDGTVMRIEDMDDAHLQNSINMTERNKKWSHYDVLIKAQKDRIVPVLEKCKYCQADMIRTEIETCEVGMSPSKYQSVCKCGARTPYEV
tara:strand:+ start:5447 stop:5821 length:375 start_codon:yes stop_codon:yes gene_type:complete